MLKKLVLICLLIPLPALAVFTAVGKKLNYLDTSAKLNYSGQGKVVVLTIDRRPYIVSGGKKPTFVGIMRGGWGNTFEVLSQTSHPLADDLSASIAGSLAAGGFTASVDVPVGDASADQAIARLSATGPDRIVMVRLQEFKTDGYASYALHTDATISVYGNDGVLLQSFDIKLDVPVGRIKMSTSYAEFAAQVSVAYRNTLETWLNDPKLSSALAEGATPAAAPAGVAVPAPASAN